MNFHAMLSLFLNITLYASIISISNLCGSESAPLDPETEKIMREVQTNTRLTKDDVLDYAIQLQTKADLIEQKAEGYQSKDFAGDLPNPSQLRYQAQKLEEIAATKESAPATASTQPETPPAQVPLSSSVESPEALELEASRLEESTHVYPENWPKIYELRHKANVLRNARERELESH